MTPVSDGCPPPSGNMTVSCSMTSSVGWSTGAWTDPFFPFLMLAEEAGCEIVQLTMVVSSSRSSGSPELQLR